jgi:mRNA interferase HigB
LRVVNTKLLDDYMAEHARSRGALRAWLAEAKDAAWSTPADVKERYPSASILSENRVVFNIAGNTFRLLCRVAYRSCVVMILKIGTHAEYDKWSL